MPFSAAASVRGRPSSTNASAKMRRTCVPSGHLADAARSSAVVAWLQSAQSSWLTGQILRINGDKLSRIQGFTEAPSVYHAKDGASLTFSEIGQAVSWLYGTLPRGLAGPLPVE